MYEAKEIDKKCRWYLSKCLNIYEDNKYLKTENIEQAERMSKSTGRKIILRLKFPDNADKCEGHFNQARILYEPYILDSI